MKRTSQRNHWEKFWGEKAQGGGVQEVYSNADRVLRNLLSVTDLTRKHVLEVGAGTGRDSFQLIGEGAVVYQLDYAENSLRILRAHAQELGVSVSLVRGDALALPFRDGSFDVVFHQGLLEHFQPSIAEALLRENVRVLKPNGYLLVDVPQRYHLYTVVKHVLIALGVWFAGWEREFSINELKGIAEKSGVTVVHRYGEWMYPSFLYRMLREMLKKFGVRLPLYPRIPLLSQLRRWIRQKLLHTPLPLYTGLSIGVIGKKYAGSASLPVAGRR